MHFGRTAAGIMIIGLTAALASCLVVPVDIVIASVTMMAIATMVGRAAYAGWNRHRAHHEFGRKLEALRRLSIA